jgi:hypothetical protein
VYLSFWRSLRSRGPGALWSAACLVDYAPSFLGRSAPTASAGAPGRAAWPHPAFIWAKNELRLEVGQLDEAGGVAAADHHAPTGRLRRRSDVADEGTFLTVAGHHNPG